MSNKYYRAIAPLRLGLAGGGTDVSPYSDLYGGVVLNATINYYAQTTIIERSDNKILICAEDRNQCYEYESVKQLPIDGHLDIIKGVYNRIVNEFVKKPLSFSIHTWVDVPPGSGLGSSSTLVVSVIGAFVEWLKLPLGEYDIANLAYEIEREDLKLAGGKQDQYAATFGGVNFMEFYGDNKVVVNPLRIKYDILAELETNLLLYYTGTSRLSSRIISRQIDNVRKKVNKSVEAMHKLKEQAILMKEALLKNDLIKIGELLDYGWRYKKQMAEGISNPVIEEIYETAKKAGAIGGKVSGAGGGGFMMLFCPGVTRYRVMRALEKFGGEFKPFRFVKNGLESWTR